MRVFFGKTGKQQKNTPPGCTVCYESYQQMKDNPDGKASRDQEQKDNAGTTALLPGRTFADLFFHFVKKNKIEGRIFVEDAGIGWARIYPMVFCSSCSSGMVRIGAILKHFLVHLQPVANEVSNGGVGSDNACRPS